VGKGEKSIKGAGIAAESGTVFHFKLKKVISSP